MSSDTPRTDEQQNDFAYELRDVVDAEFAQQLERELNASRADVDRLREEANNWHRHYRDEANNAQKCKQAYIELEKEVERLKKRPFGCKCENLTEKALGDGCDECNKALVIEMLSEERDELKAEVESLEKQLDSTKRLALKFWKVLEENGFKLDPPK